MVSQSVLDGKKLSDLSDETLAQLCKERGLKDQRPFTELYRRYQGYVWRICYYYVQTPQGAEDLMQEVFFKVYRGLKDFEGRSSLKTWLNRIANNTCLNEIRSWEQRPQLYSEPFEFFADFIRAEEDAGFSRSRTPVLTDMALAMTKLHSDEIEVIQMKDLDERTYDELAQMLEISVSAAKMRVQRARLSLRAAYEGEKGAEMS